MKCSVDENNIDGSSQAFDYFDFEYCALEFIFLSQFVLVLGLALSHNERHQIRETFSCDGRSGHHQQIIIPMCFIVKSRIEALLSKS